MNFVLIYTKKYYLLFSLFIFFTINNSELNAQNIEFSTLLGKNVSLNNSIVKDGYSYFLGNIFLDANQVFPITPKDYRIQTLNHSSSNNSFIAKVDPNGDFVYLALFDEILNGNSFFKLVNNEIILTGSAPIYNLIPPTELFYPVEYDCYVTKLDNDGNKVFTSAHQLLGDEYINDVIIDNDNLYFTGFSDNLSESIFSRVDLNSGNIIYYNSFGGSDFDEGTKLLKKNNDVYVLGITQSTDFFVAESGQNAQPNDIFISKFNANSGNTIFNKKYGGSYNEYPVDFKLIGQDIVFCGMTTSPDFYTTDGTTFNPLNDIKNSEVFVTRIDINGEINYSSIYGQEGDTYFFDEIKIKNDDVYINMWYGNVTVITSKFNTISTNQNNNFHVTIGTEILAGNLPLEIDNQSVYTLGETLSQNFTTTDGSINSGGSDAYMVKLDANTGSIIFSKLFGHGNHDFIRSIQVDNCKVHLFGQVVNSFSSAVNYYNFDKQSGELLFEKQITTTEGTVALKGVLEGNSYYFICSNGIDYIVNSNFPVTKTRDLQYGNIQYTNSILKFNLCNTGFIIANDNITNPFQEVCQNGLVGKINANKIRIPSSALTQVYIQSDLTEQNEIIASYQWQEATNSNGPWSNIPGAFEQNFTPTNSLITKYYRRLSTNKLCCPQQLISTSGVATVQVGPNSAPTVNAGGFFRTCPGSAVQLGATPTVTGGLEPYTYDWDYNADDIANPNVSPNQTTVYSLLVTDANGCQQLDQALVNVYVAQAGGDLSTCGNSAVTINATPVQGSSTTTYLWEPNLFLSCNNCPTPIVNNPNDQIYTLTLTIDKGDGTTCFTTDQVTVLHVNPPSIANFAGEDVTGCFGESLSLGSNNLSSEDLESFDYTWAPGSYLNDNHLSNVVYNPGTITFPPFPDPSVYSLTARKNGCSFVDQMTVNVIRADAGESGCGPRLIGGNSDVAGLNEVFSWELVGGQGSFLGPTNTSQVYVSASDPNNPARYRLTTTLNGVSCVDDIIVAACLCDVDINPESSFGCPNSNLGPLTLNLSIFNIPEPYTIEWVPQIGLSNYNSASVDVIGTQEVTYTVTVKNNFDETVTCSESITVNQPNMTIPQFTAQDHTICSGSTVFLGEPFVAEYSYLWTPNSGNLSAVDASNPSASPQGSTIYTVKVTDIGTGCYVTDQAEITVQNIHIDAGDDLTVCNNSSITLGNDPIPNYSYSWFPFDAPWQNGTNQNSPNPEVLVSTNLLFTLTATDQITGCSSTDDVQITLNNNPSINQINDLSFCSGQSAKFVNPPVNGVIYSWLPTQGLSCSDCAEPTVSVTSTQIYTLSALFLGGCDPVTQEVAVNILQSTEFSLADISFCPGTQFEIGFDAPEGMSSYSWSPAENLGNPTERITLVYETFDAIDYTLTIINENNCESSAIVNLTPSMIRPFAGGDQTICLGESIVLGSDENIENENISYLWYDQDFVEIAYTELVNLTPTTAGIFQYYFVVMDNNTGCINYQLINLTVNNSLELPLLSGDIICNGSDLQIGFNPLDYSIPNGTIYFWTTNNNTQNTISSPTTPTTLVSPIENTVYILNVIPANHCSSQTTVTIGVSSNLAPEIQFSNPDVCLSQGSFTVNSTITPSNQNYSYSWSTSPDEYLNDAFLSSTTIPNPEILVYDIGNFSYYLTVTNLSDGCSNSAELNYNVINCPAPCSLTLNGPDYFCTDQMVNLYASATPQGGTFTWSTGQTDQVISAQPASNAEQNYSVTYTNLENNCNESATITVPFNGDCCPNPELRCNDVVINSNFDPCDNLISYDLPPPAIGNPCGSILSMTNNHIGNTFELGTTNVTWTVTNTEGDVSTCIQQITFLLPGSGE